MHVISKKALSDFADEHRINRVPLDAWYQIVSKTDFANFAALRATFNTVDVVRGFYVFDIAGNKYRLVAAIHFDKQRLYIRHVFTHAQYDRWSKQ